MYPVAGNEKAIGLDYRKNPAQRAAALRARDERALVLAGPVDLQQGGQGFIGRFPVFVKSAGDSERFWGIVSAVVDVQRLYQASGLLDDDLAIDVALTGKDGSGEAGPRFFGGDNVAANNPVKASVQLPSGSWEIAAIPRDGWKTTPDNAWFLRAIMTMAGALVVIPILVAGRLIRERQRNYAELARLSRRLELALEASSIGVWEHDLATDTLVWDDRVNELYGKPADGKPRGYDDWAGAIHPLDVEKAVADFDWAVTTKQPYRSAYRVVRPDGEVRYLRSSAAFYEDDSGATKMIGAEWDVTDDVVLNKDLEHARQLSESRTAELELTKARIEHNALHDSLTGLPNRRYLDQILEQYAASSRSDGSQVALLHIDLDRFKQINDTLGHAAGDAMLIHVSEVLRSNVGDTDFVGRIGGDEFVVVCKAADARQLGLLADRIIRQMREPVFYKGHQCRFGVSIGIATSPQNKLDSADLLVNADIALYRAKSRGRNRHEFFTEALQSEIVNTKRVADEILSGLERNEFVAHYQPQFDAKTLEITGVEALARWNHPTRGILAPDVFLKIAEELNVVAIIDRSILEQALKSFDDWTADELHVPRVSVNVSARRLEDKELIKSLRKLKIKKDTVSFELVEFDLPRRERRPRRVECRADQGARHRYRDRRFRHRLCLDRQPAQAAAAPAQDRSPAGGADRQIAAAAEARLVDHRDRPLAGHRGHRRRRGNDGACAHPQGPRLRHAAGLRLRPPDGCGEPDGVRSIPALARGKLVRRMRCGCLQERSRMAKFDWHSDPITPETPVTKSYKNTQNVRRFLTAECGPAFRFDRDFMAWIKDGSDKTMGDVAREWRRRVGSVPAMRLDAKLNVRLAPRSSHRPYVPECRNRAPENRTRGSRLFRQGLIDHR